MDFFKVKRFRLCLKPKLGEQTDFENNVKPESGESEGSGEPGCRESVPDGVAEEDYDDDDFITNEVKRRIKELKKNSFMVLIPEESCLEEEETTSSEWRESDLEDAYQCCRFDTFYSCYCERMIFFDKMIVQHLKEADSWSMLTQSPRFATKKLAFAIKSFSFKRQDEIQGDCEQLKPPLEDGPFQNLEIAYVAQICLSWEALHCQYTQLSQQILTHPEKSSSFGHYAQLFQQFQVLLRRFIENEPFEQGLRVEIYARLRSSLPKLLQVPTTQGFDNNENGNEDMIDPSVLSQQLLNLMEDSILTFRCFLKKDKNNLCSYVNLIKGHNNDASSLHQVQTSLAKKQAKLKELSKNKGWKKSWPATSSEVELLFALVDIEVVKRVLKMADLNKEKLLWCEEKLSKLDLSGNKLTRNGTPILFPL